MSDKQILYLGLDASRLQQEGNITHYPLIKIVPRPYTQVKQAFQNVEKWSDILLTSRSAASIFFAYCDKDLKNKRFIVVGKATEAKVKEYGAFETVVAEQECGEGVIEILTLLAPSYVFFPHSSLARPLIVEFLQEKQISHSHCILYDTIAHYTPPLPKIDFFDEIIFSSPSQVHAFKLFFNALPKDKKLTATGPITAKTLANFLESA